MLGRVLLVSALALAAASCNKGAAADALKAATQALAAAPEVEREAPEEWAAIEHALRDARTSYDAGRYTDALRTAQALPDRIAAARALAAQRQQQRAAEWTMLSRELPQRLDALTARLALLVSGGWISSEREADARATLGALGQAWEGAKAASAAADLAAAVAAGRDVLARAEKLAAGLGLKPPASPAPAAPR